MKQTDRILVVIDPTAAQQPAAERGVALARTLGWSVEFFICHYDPRLTGTGLFASADRKEIRKRALAHQLGYLNTLAKPHRAAGLNIAAKAVWDTPLHEGIIREVLRSEPRLVMKDTHYHSAVSRTLFTNTDWHLIRDCPAPLWLVKPGPFDASTVLAAVDPMHEHDKPASLDKRILEEAEFFAEALDGQLHMFHGYDAVPAIASAGAYSVSPTPLPVEEIVADIEKAHADRFRELADFRGVEAAHTHLRSGPPAETLPLLARELGAGLVVMGAISRSRLQQAIIGSTAERVLDHLHCDVLVVKPEGFESEVSYKPQGRGFQELRATG